MIRKRDIILKNSFSQIFFRIVFLFAVLAVFRQFTIAAVPNPQKQNAISFENISLEQGLSQASTNSITQDEKGFMWFGTQDGLNKYDGYTFITYKNEPNDPTSLSDNHIRYLYTDKNGDLWICTYNRGLNKFNRETSTFTRYLHNPEDPSSISNDEVSVIYEDRENVLWVGTLGGGLDRLDRKTGHFSHYHHISGNPESLNCDLIRAIFEDSKGNLWIGTYGGGLNKLNQSSRDIGTFSHFVHEIDKPFSLNNNFVTCIIETSKGVYWVGTDGGGMSRFDPEKGTFVPYIYRPDNALGLSHNLVTFIYEDKESNLWIGTYGGGLNIFDPLKGTFTYYKHRAKLDGSLNHDFVLSIYKNNIDIVWIGTYAGINKYDPLRLQFYHLERNNDYPNCLNENDIRAIFEDDKGILWIGTYNSGIDEINRKTGSFTHYSHDPKIPGSLPDDRIFAILKDSTGVLWAGSPGGLMSMTGKTRRFTYYKNDPLNPNSLSNNKVRSIYEDSKGRIWIATMGGGLNRFDREKGTFYHYRHNPDNHFSISSDKVFTVREDKNGILWIGTFGGGLNKFVPGKEIFTHYRYNPNNENSLSNDRIFSLHIQEKKITGNDETILWIGTDGGGLNRFETQTGKWTHYFQGIEVNGLPSNVIYGILEDKRGNFWITTTRGLSKYDYQSQSFWNYTVNDGLQNTEYNSGAYYRNTITGEMFFGGFNGLNSFFPDAMISNSSINPVVITTTKKFNSKFQSKKPIEVIKDFRLSYRDNIFSFDFVSPEYRHPDRIQYMYKLEGSDMKWIPSDSRRHVNYTDVPDGNYVFRVKCFNPDGAMSEASIKITIVPPFWRTTIFKVITIAVILLSVLSFIQLRTRVIRKRNRQLEAFNQQLQQEIAERQQAEVLQATLYQIADITHSNMEFDEIYRSIHQSIARLIDAGNFYIALYDSQENSIFLPYFIDEFDDYMGRMIKAFKGLTEYIIRNNRSLLASQSKLHELAKKGEVNLFGTIPEIWLGVPLKFKDEIFGAVVVQHYSNPKAYTEKDKKMLEFASEQIAGVLYRKREADEKKELKEKLILSEKMEAIGRLAGGVAHDLNNVLSAIVSYPELLLMKLSPDSPMRKPLLTVKESGQRAAAIVQDLLTLARRGVEVNEVVNWNNILRDYMKSPVFDRLKSSHPNIKIEVNLEKNLLNIEGSPVHLTKTIMNLCSNAVEAMPQGGTITLATCNLFQDKDIEGYGIHNYVVVSVTDTGIGIAKQDLKRIFEPFYTKKEMGISGTGLGMTIVWNTVHDHNGYINLSSEEGKGTIFELYFPVTHAVVCKKKKAISIDEFKGNGERVLVIDDMLEQREILNILLTELGYSVICVPGGEEAVTYMEQHGEEVALLVLDMIMGNGMDGLDTFKEILKIKPGIKAIIASGFSETARVKEAMKLGAGAYIRKPYTLEKIGLAIKKELEK